MCEECESFHERSGQLDKVMGQSIVLSENKTEVLLENDDPEYENFLLQRYEERIKSLSQTDSFSKFAWMQDFCVVDFEQYFMTKTMKHNFMQRLVVNILPRSDESSQPKGWIQGNTNIGPVLEVTISCLYCKTRS